MCARGERLGLPPPHGFGMPNTFERLKFAVVVCLCCGARGTTAVVGTTDCGANMRKVFSSSLVAGSCGWRKICCVCCKEEEIGVVGLNVVECCNMRGSEREANSEDNWSGELLSCAASDSCFTIGISGSTR